MALRAGPQDSPIQEKPAANCCQGGKEEMGYYAEKEGVHVAIGPPTYSLMVSIQPMPST